MIYLPVNQGLFGFKANNCGTVHYQLIKYNPSSLLFTYQGAVVGCTRIISQIRGKGKPRFMLTCCNMLNVSQTSVAQCKASKDITEKTNGKKSHSQQVYLPVCKTNMTPATAPAAADGITKHRACDECRE